MAVAIRLARKGRTHRPFYRVVAIDERHHREGRTAAILGTYDPLLKEKNVQVDIDRVHEWIRSGAKLSDNLASLLDHFGYETEPAESREAEAKRLARKKKKRQSRKKKDPNKFVPASNRAVKRHRAKLKAARMAEENEKAAARKAEEEKKAAEAERKEAEAAEAAKAAEEQEAPAEEANAEAPAEEAKAEEAPAEEPAEDASGEDENRG